MTLQDLKDNREQIIEKILSFEKGDNSRLVEIMAAIKEFVESGSDFSNWEELVDFVLEYCFRARSRKVSKTASIICEMEDKGYLKKYDIRNNLH